MMKATFIRTIDGYTFHREFPIFPLIDNPVYLIKIREVRPVSRSYNPRFYQFWLDECIPSVDVEGACAQLEGLTTSDDMEAIK